MKEDNKEIKNKEVKDRRTLLKGLVAGSAVVTGSKALPETWTKPMTDAVILPGHASTTSDFAGGDYGDGAGQSGGDAEDFDYRGSDREDFEGDNGPRGDKYQNYYDNDGEGADYGSEDDDALAADDYRPK